MSDLPATAPRGKQFAVARLTQPIDPCSVAIPAARWDDLAGAAAAAAKVDWRLQPTVILVERARP